jgi:hypothetical protein
MAHLFTFNSGQFREQDERTNPINPIGGEGVLKWLSTQLAGQGFEVGEPDAEDWGWYTHVSVGPRTYLLGASGEWENEAERADWTIQLDLRRSFWERLKTSTAMRSEDPLSTSVESLLRANSDFRNLAVDRAG